MNNITLYTTHCPQCTILQKKLDSAGIEYNISEDVQEMLQLGFMAAPILKVDNDTYTFKEACLWVDDYVYEKEGDCESCKLT